MMVTRHITKTEHQARSTIDGKRGELYVLELTGGSCCTQARTRQGKECRSSCSCAGVWSKGVKLSMYRRWERNVHGIFLS
jgi:hypothetical protein